MSASIGTNGKIVENGGTACRQIRKFTETESARANHSIDASRPFSTAIVLSSLGEQTLPYGVERGGMGRMVNINTVAAESILITERLFGREPRPPDLDAEASAFHLLSDALLTDTDGAMQCFVDVALKLCPSAGSAGVSELEDGETQFRWTALSGVFAPHVNGVAPRDFSPCGLCLDAHHAILVDRPARRFGYLGAAGEPIIEGLIVPLYDTSKTPLGTIWIVSHNEDARFDATDVRVIEQLAVFLVLAIKLRIESTRRSSPAAADLLRRIAVAGDKAAFAELFNQFAGRVKAMLIRHGCDSAEAEDCTQDAMLAVWRKADQFDPARASPAAWIYTIARNRYVDTCRRRASPEDFRISTSTPGPTPEELLNKIEAVSHVRAAIAALPPSQLEIIRRAFYNDETHVEIATGLGLPLGTVKSRLRLAANHLRRLLRDLP